MLQDLVNVSRGKVKPLEICRLADIVNAAYEVIRHFAESRGVKVIIEVPERIELPLERARVERVFLNLMNNALEAMPDGGELRITAVRDEQHLLVQVDDTGTGISDRVRATLFQPFSSYGKKNGLGLGLALSRQTILDHGGELGAGNKPGPGARFFVRFPISPFAHLPATSHDEYLNVNR